MISLSAYPDLVSRAITGPPAVATAPQGQRNGTLERIAAAILSPPAPMPTDLRTPDLRGASMLSSQNMRALISQTQQAAQVDLAARQAAAQAVNQQRQQDAENRLVQERAIQQAIMGQAQIQQGREEMIARAADAALRGGIEREKMALDTKLAADAGLRADKKLALDEKEAGSLAEYRNASLAQRASRDGGGGGSEGIQAPKPKTGAQLQHQNKLIDVFASDYADRVTKADRKSDEWKRAHDSQVLQQQRQAAAHQGPEPYMPQGMGLQDLAVAAIEQAQPTSETAIEPPPENRSIWNRLLGGTSDAPAEVDLGDISELLKKRE